MSGLPEEKKSGEEFDFDLDLDSLDDAALQKLLEEDPALEEELAAIEAAEQAALEEGDESVAEALSDEDDSEEIALFAAEPAADDVEPEEDEDVVAQAPEETKVEDETEEDVALPPLTATPTHDDLADYSFDEEGDEKAEAEALSTALSTSVEFGEDDHSQPAIQPVPRINIHAFCVTDRMSTLVEQASADRRLAKAHLTLQSGDAFVAAEAFSNEPTPNLILMEAGNDPKALLAGLDRLAQVCDPSTRVVIVGDLNDIRLYRELMDRGISDYVVKPTSPLQIISAISDLYADPSAPPIGKTYVFVGARGGTGSSSICHNVAWDMAESFKMDTVLVDLDLAFGTAGLDFEYDPTQGLAEALSAPERLDAVLLDRLLQKCTDRLSLFGAPNMLDRDYDLPPESFETVMDLVKTVAPTIAVDLPHVWSGWARMLLQTADEIVLTATPDLSSFRNAKNIVETIKTHRTNDAPPILVLNQTNVPKRPEVPAEQFEEALGLEPKIMIPWDPVAFGTAATNAQPLSEAAPKAKVTAEINKISRLLTGRDSMNDNGSGFSLKSLFAKRG